MYEAVQSLSAKLDALLRASESVDWTDICRIPGCRILACAGSLLVLDALLWLLVIVPPLLTLHASKATFTRCSATQLMSASLTDTNLS